MQTVMRTAYFTTSFHQYGEFLISFQGVGNFVSSSLATHLLHPPRSRLTWEITLKGCLYVAIDQEAAKGKAQ